VNNVARGVRQVRYNVARGVRSNQTQVWTKQSNLKAPLNKRKKKEEKNPNP